MEHTTQQCQDSPVEVSEPPLSGRGDLPAEQEEGNKTAIWFLVAALVTAIGLVLYVALTSIWDPYVCTTNDQCRGLQRCFQGRCESPEIWLDDVDRACRQALELRGSCISVEAWEKVD